MRSRGTYVVAFSILSAFTIDSNQALAAAWPGLVKAPQKI